TEGEKAPVLRPGVAERDRELRRGGGVARPLDDDDRVVRQVRRLGEGARREADERQKRQQAGARQATRHRVPPCAGRGWEKTSRGGPAPAWAADYSRPAWRGKGNPGPGCAPPPTARRRGVRGGEERTVLMASAGMPCGEKVRFRAAAAPETNWPGLPPLAPIDTPSSPALGRAPGQPGAIVHNDALRRRRTAAPPSGQQAMMLTGRPAGPD